MSEAKARRLAAMMTEKQRLDMLLLASVIQAESGRRKEVAAK